MADWTDLTSSSTYSAVLNALLDRTKALSKMALASETSLPTGAITAVPDDGKFQRWDGTAWADWQFKAAAIAANAVDATKIRLAVNAGLRARNTADDADISLIYLGTGDKTVIGAATGKDIVLTNGSVRWLLEGANHAWIPNTSNAYDIGNASYRVRRLFLGSGTEMPTTDVKAAGSSQATATACTTRGTIRVTSGSGGIKLPQSAAGDLWMVINATPSITLSIYPYSGDQFYGGGGANLPITQGYGSGGGVSLLYCDQAGYIVRLSSRECP